VTDLVLVTNHQLNEDAQKRLVSYNGAPGVFCRNVVMTRKITSLVCYCSPIISKELENEEEFAQMCKSIAEGMCMGIKKFI